MHVSLRCLHGGEGGTLQRRVGAPSESLSLSLDGTSAAALGPLTVEGESALSHGHGSQSGAQAAAEAAKCCHEAGRFRKIYCGQLC